MSCPSCGKELPAAFPFCPFCGASVAGAQPAPGREERKLVTVLFVDLAGFTARAERLDPEDVRSLLAPYHAHVRSELERFGGTLEKFIGDAVVALFGAPAAHEDDPERAVRAALAIRDWAGERSDGLHVRIGVNTGEALVALDARPGAGEGMAAGDVVNTAARLQAAAPLNGVLVGSRTYRATSQAIEYREAEPVVARGKREPVEAWEALRARSRVGVDVAQRASVPLVGRARELELLVSTLARVREERAPQLVTLVGVPGIGKSRLVRELLAAVERDPALVRWRQGRSLPYGEGVTFWGLAEIVKAQAGILESDAPAQAEEKLGRAVAAAATDPAEAQWLARHLGPLVGLGADGTSRQDEAFGAWSRFLEALAADRPLVLVFEDLHWADDAMLDFVDRLVERASGVPMLVLATARPELLRRRSGWGGGKPNALTISLSPLSGEETTRLVEALLEAPGVEPALRDALVARAGGNPLFAEQYARALLERGSLVDLPETVHGIIAARLDGLPDEEKRLLQDAAVIGKVFWLGAVQAVGGATRWHAEELLHGLERREFVQRARVSSVAGEAEYAFRHALIRDVAYGQIPRAARSRKHERAAAWVESLRRSDDHAEMLAHHYLQALELAEAAGLEPAELGESARRALRDAGDRAAALYSVEAAERFYDAALRLCPEGGAERAELLLRCAVPVGRHAAGGDPARLAQARDALLAIGDRARAAEAEMLISQRRRMEGRMQLADEHGERAVALLAEAPPSRSGVWVLGRHATRASLMGEHARAIEIAEQARGMAEEIGWAEGLSEALNLRGLERVFTGDAGGLDDLERSIELARSGDVGDLARVVNGLAVAYQVLGDLELAYRARVQSHEAARRVASDSLERWFQATLADHHYRRGEWDRARAAADGVIERIEAGSPTVIGWQAYAVRAELRLAAGDAGGAVADAEAALASGRENGEVQAVSFVLAAGAHVLSLAAWEERALPPARELVDSLRGGADMQFAVINLPLLASAARRLGLGPELRAALDGYPATRWVDAVRAYLDGDFTGAAEALARIGTRPDEAEARLRAGERLLAAGRPAESADQLGRALELYRSMGAARFVEECEALLAAV